MLTFTKPMYKFRVYSNGFTQSHIHKQPSYKHREALLKDNDHRDLFRKN